MRGSHFGRILTDQAEAEGFEPPAPLLKPTENRPFSQDAAQIAAHSPKTSLELVEIAAAWSQLPVGVKAGIIALVRATNHI